MAREEYIPSARDAVIGRFGRNAANLLRQYCNCCNDKSPLAGYDGRPEPDKIYGDLGTSRDSGIAKDWQCDVCGVFFVDLAAQCQAEHDEQQARWAKQPVVALVEYGIPAAIRCRVY